MKKGILHPNGYIDRPHDAEFDRYLPEDSQGLKVWRNEHNKFVVVELHYTADPKKRTAEWKQNAKRGLPEEEWEREYEMCWTTYGGKPVYGRNFNAQIHVPKQTIAAEPSLPLVRGWDSAGLPACAICQLVGRRLKVLSALPTSSFIPATEFVPYVLNYCHKTYGDHTWIDIVDPATFDEGKTVEGKAWADKLREYGLNPIAGERLFEARRNAVVDLLRTLEDGVSLLQINPTGDNCDFVIRGFEGGYQYPEKTSPNSSLRPDRPLKNEYSHIQDAIQYVATRLTMVPRLIRRRPHATMSKPAARYKFTRK